MLLELPPRASDRIIRALAPRGERIKKKTNEQKENYKEMITRINKISRQSKPISTNSNKYQTISTNINTYKQIPTNINKYQHI